MERTQFFHSENTTFSAAVSDAALGEGYDRANPSSRAVVVQREAIRNATSGNFASLLCMLALSSVTGMDITTVYPEITGQESKYSRMQNGIIKPRISHGRFVSKVVQNVKLIILWSRDGMNVLPGVGTMFQPNHFVPLVQYKPKGQQQAHHRGLSPKFQSKSAKGQQQRSINDLLKAPNVDKKSGMYQYSSDKNNCFRLYIKWQKTYCSHCRNF